jgi:hypothetical protein
MYIYAAFSPQSQHNQFKDHSAKTHAQSIKVSLCQPLSPKRCFMEEADKQR